MLNLYTGKGNVLKIAPTPFKLNITGTLTSTQKPKETIMDKLLIILVICIASAIAKADNLNEEGHIAQKAIACIPVLMIENMHKGKRVHDEEPLLRFAYDELIRIERIPDGSSILKLEKKRILSIFRRMTESEKLKTCLTHLEEVK